MHKSYTLLTCLINFKINLLQYSATFRLICMFACVYVLQAINAGINTCKGFIYEHVFAINCTYLYIYMYISILQVCKTGSHICGKYVCR